MSTWYIPARTGPTLDRCRFMRWEGVYPCSHRANQARRTLPTTAPGISLLTRGQRAERCPLGPCIGYIPAYAGPTLGRTPPGGSWSVYPCLRGANPCGVIDSITKCLSRCPVSGHSPSLFDDAGGLRCGLEFADAVDRDAGAAPRVENRVLLESVRQPLVDFCWLHAATRPGDEVGAELGGQQVEAGVLATRRARSRTIRRQCDELGFRRGGCAWCLLARCCWSVFGPPKMDWRGPFRARVRCLSWWRTPTGGRRAVEGPRFQLAQMCGPNSCLESVIWRNCATIWHKCAGLIWRKCDSETREE